MREVTAKEWATVFEGIFTEVSPVDYYGITFEMSKACIEYNEEDKELCFTTGNYNKDGIGSVIIKEELVDTIEHDEESEVYVITFISDIPDVVVTRFKDLAELEKECAERKQQ